VAHSHCMQAGVCNGTVMCEHLACKTCTLAVREQIATAIAAVDAQVNSVAKALSQYAAKTAVSALDDKVKELKKTVDALTSAAQGDAASSDVAQGND
jgi:hypothetical protein